MVKVTHVAAEDAREDAGTKGTILVEDFTIQASEGISAV